MARVYVSIGSNIDKEKNIPSSVLALQSRFGELEISKVYETKAVGFDGDEFHNLVVAFDTLMSPTEISQILKQIEVEHERTRGKEQFVSRTLDLDQILYGTLIMFMDGVKVPHPDIMRYNFVLKPMVELAADLIHPQNDKTMLELWNEFENKDGLNVIKYNFN